MNLTRMELRDLKTLREWLDVMIVYGGHLARIEHDDDGEIIFSLAPGEYATITLPFRMPDLGGAAVGAVDPIELVERETGDRAQFLRNGFGLAAVEARADEVQVQEPVPAAESPKPAPAPEVAPAQRAVAEGLVTGPLSDDERTLIGQMVDQGCGAAEIAGRLRRRVQTVDLFLNRAEAGKVMSVVQPSAVQPSGNAVGLADAAAEAPKVKPAALPVAARAPAPASAAVCAAPTAPVEDHAVRPAWWHQISATLEAVGHKGGWTPARDLEMVEEATRGTPWEIIADQVGVEVRAAKARFIALTPDGAGFERQSRLIEVLRSKVAAQV